MKIEKKLDKWLWFLLMLAPLLITIVKLWGQQTNYIDWQYSLQIALNAFDLDNSNIITNTIQSLGNYIIAEPFQKGHTLNMYMTWIIIVQLAHVAVDVCLFIVKVGRELCEKII